MKKKHKIRMILSVFLVGLLLLPLMPNVLVMASEADTEVVSELSKAGSPFFGTVWALLAPVIAIILALVTKEVYLSLFSGIVAGALLYCNFHPIKAVETVFYDGLLGEMTNRGNAGILVFLVLLGIMVTLMNKAGGSRAYGEWAKTKIKSRKMAMLSTILLGSLIFVDDYFNCLTVGSVMRPVTDKFKISRAKLAYIIDSTAAPICILAPISSWAAAVTGIVSDSEEGLSLFIRSIPYNFYAILTIVMVVGITLLNLDLGSMKQHEENAQNGDLYTTRPPESEPTDTITGHGKVKDLVLPVIALVVFCVAGMLYTGGFFHGKGFHEAFVYCDAPSGLVYGSFAALVFTFLLYIPRKIISVKEFMGAIPDGFKSMVPAILILLFAWTLSAVTGLLGADQFVSGLMEQNAASLQLMLPAIIFLVSIGLAFSTGTSWGTFTILLPIVAEVLSPGSELMIIAISACLAGAVCGDHISPISDTTVMASAGASCDHISHVTTQLLYAIIVAAISFVAYVIAAFIQNAIISLLIAIIMLLTVLFILKSVEQRKKMS